MEWFEVSHRGKLKASDQREENRGQQALLTSCLLALLQEGQVWRPETTERSRGLWRNWRVSAVDMESLPPPLANSPSGREGLLAPILSALSMEPWSHQLLTHGLRCWEQPDPRSPDSEALAETWGTNRGPFWKLSSSREPSGAGRGHGDPTSSQLNLIFPPPSLLRCWSSHGALNSVSKSASVRSGFTASCRSGFYTGKPTGKWVWG